MHHACPTCGTITPAVTLSGDGEKVDDVSYDGQGCSIQSGGRLVLADQVIGQNVGDALKTVEGFSEMITSRGTVEGDEDLIGDGIAFAGVSASGAGECALLGWMAFKDAVAQASVEKDQGGRQ